MYPEIELSEYSMYYSRQKQEGAKHIINMYIIN